MKFSINRILKHPFFQGGIFLVAANFLIGLLNYFFNIFSARMLGPEGYSDITAFFAVLAVISTPITAIGTVLVQKIGLRGEDGESYVHALELWFLNTLRRWWPVGALSLFIIPFSPEITNISPIVAYSIIPIFIYSLIATFYEGVLQGLHLFFWIALAGLLATLLKLAGIGLAQMTIFPLLAIMIFFHISALSRIAISKWILSHKIKKKNVPTKPIEKTMMNVFTDKQVVITILSLFAIVLLNNIDIVYVKKVFSAEDAGIYSAWALLAKIILYAIGPLLSLSYIFFASKKTEMQHQLVLIGGLLLFVILGIASNLAYGFFDLELINLFFGPKFYSLKPFVEWASLFGIGYVMVNFMNCYFLAKGSKFTMILPLSVPLYLLGLYFYVASMTDLIFFNTVFIFFVLSLYLLAFFKDRFVFLFSSKA